jgi:hypothetical protein
VILRAGTEQRLLQIGRAAVASFSVLDADEARAAIDLALNGDLQPSEDDAGLIAVKVAEIWIDPADRQMAEAHQALDRDTALARAQQEQKIERLRILSDHVLSDPALAALWWLDGKPDKLQEMVTLHKTKVFTDAASLFSMSAEQAMADPIPGLIRQFLDGLGPELRQQLIEQLNLVFRSYERHDLTTQLSSYAAS